MIFFLGNSDMFTSTKMFPFSGILGNLQQSLTDSWVTAVPDLMKLTVKCTRDTKQTSALCCVWSQTMDNKQPGGGRSGERQQGELPGGEHPWPDLQEMSVYYYVLSKKRSKSFSYIQVPWVLVLPPPSTLPFPPSLPTPGILSFSCCPCLRAIWNALSYAWSFPLYQVNSYPAFKAQLTW